MVKRMGILGALGATGPDDESADAHVTLQRASNRRARPARIPRW